MPTRKGECSSEAILLHKLSKRSSKGIMCLIEELTTIKEDPDSASNLLPLATKGVFAGVDISILHCLVDFDAILDKKLETDSRIKSKVRAFTENWQIGIIINALIFEDKKNILLGKLWSLWFISRA